MCKVSPLWSKLQCSKSPSDSSSHSCGEEGKLLSLKSSAGVTETGAIQVMSVHLTTKF